MTPQAIRELLEGVRTQAVDVDQAMEKLKSLPFRDLDYAKVDNHRQLRTGFPEVIFCEGKTFGQVAGILRAMEASHQNILGTRASAELYAALRPQFPKLEYHAAARILFLPGSSASPALRARLLVVSAGTADIPVAEEAAVTAEKLGMQVEHLFDVGVAGIHRLLAKKDRIATADVIVVVAGMEGALASVVGGLAEAPVIAVPTSIGYGASFGGLAALLAMLNSCAAGVAVMNIDNGFGAGQLAAIIARKIGAGPNSNT